MIRILAADGIESGARKKLINDGFEVVEKYYNPEILGEELKNFDAVVVRSATKIKKNIIDKALESGRLKLVIRAGVGIDNIDADYAMEKGLMVTNTPNASSASVAELTIGHMFALARYINISNVTMRDGKWEKKKYEGIELSGKTLGLIGFGRISREVAKRADALGMRVIYTDILGRVEEFDNFEFLSMSELLRQSDFVSLHVPFDSSADAVISDKELKLMKDGSYIINCARGGVVDEDALLNALNSGKLAGVALDVFKDEPSINKELINHPKVSVTPHIGASTVEAQFRIGEEVVNTIETFFK